MERAEATASRVSSSATPWEASEGVCTILGSRGFSVEGLGLGPYLKRTPALNPDLKP